MYAVAVLGIAMVGGSRIREVILTLGTSREPQEDAWSARCCDIRHNSAVRGVYRDVHQEKHRPHTGTERDLNSSRALPFRASYDVVNIPR